MRAASRRPRRRALALGSVLVAVLTGLGAGGAAGGRAEERIVFASSRTSEPATAIYVLSPGAPPGRRLRLLAAGQEPSWSPDGRHAIFRALTAAGWQLFRATPDGADVRQLTRLPGGVLFPAWSADGERVAFAAETELGRELFVMRADGGDVLQLTHGGRLGPACCATAWSPDGRYLAVLAGANFYHPDLYVVAAAGGEPLRLTTERDQFTRNILPLSRLPVEWAPDGRALAARALGPVLLVFDPETGARTTFDGARQFGWGAGARLAYTRDRGNMLEVVLARRDGTVLAVLRNAWSATWSPSGRELSFLREARPGGADVYVVDADGGAERRLTRDGSHVRPLLAKAWSPDGTGIAVVRGRDRAVRHEDGTWTLDSTGAGVLSVVGVAAARSRPLAELVLGSPAADVGWPGHDVSPLWSRDGRLVAVRQPLGSILVAPVGGGAPRRVRFGWPPRHVRDDAAWSPAGRSLLFSASLQWSDHELYSVRPDGTGLRRLTRNGAEDVQPAWSPDRSRIAFVRVRGPFWTRARGGNQYGALHVMRGDGSGVRRLVRRRAASPAFSPDGRRVAFVRDNQLWTVRSDGGDERRVGPADVRARGISWTPDGRRIAYAAGLTRDRLAGIFVVGRDGGRPRRIPGTGFGDTEPAWSPDGRRIAFVRAEGRRSALHVVGSDGRGLRRVLACEPARALQPGCGGGHRFPSWSPDGRSIVLEDWGRVVVVGADGGALRQLAPLAWHDNRQPFQDAHPAWSR